MGGCSPLNDVFQKNRTDAIRQKLLHQRSLFRPDSVWQHIWSAWSQAPLYARWQQFLLYFRRVRLVAYLFRASLFILTVLEAGILAVTATILLLLLLPPLVLFAVGILLAVLIESPHRNHYFWDQTMQKRIYVLFLQDPDSAFFKGNARSLASDDSIVIIVSPFWLSPRGIRGKSLYSTARREYKNVYIVRRYYYFTLKRHVLTKRNTAFLY